MAHRSSRREFVRTVGAAAAGAAVAGTPAVWASAAAAETIKLGFISPRTGPLGSFGECDPFILETARKTLAKGITVGGKHYAVEVLDRDSQSDPARAGQLANELITREKIDFMLVTSTPEVVNPVSDACEAAGMPCLGTIMPWEAWYFGRGAKPGAPSPFKWTYLFSFGVKAFLDCYVSQWKLLPHNKNVAALLPNDADGNAIREHLVPDLRKAGYNVVDPGGYEDGTTDFSSQIARFKSENCEVFFTFPIPPDFATFWRQAAQQGYTKMVKIAQVAKTGLFPGTTEALGSLGDRLSSGAYWHRDFPYPSPFNGMRSRELADAYEKATGRQWNQQLGASLSLFDVGMEALKNSGNPKNKAAVAKAISRIDMTSIVGKVDFTHGPVPNVATTLIIGDQWVKSKPGSKYPFDLVLTEHAGDPHIPITAKLLPYNA
ncbi:MAG TPA: ABC transporter substrate-binding protein [Candidatus Baltobacteraceae bacterium]|nr:ABC transporter substrate-binding protein [Candidatus Baltobacteraceae bacterium]